MSSKVKVLLLTLIFITSYFFVVNDMFERRIIKKAGASITPSSGWSYVRQLDISNPRANYQLCIHIIKGTGTDDPANNTIYIPDSYWQNYPYDIRFGSTSDPSTAVMLPQWLESYNTTDAWYWVNTTSANYSTIYLYVGNADAELYSVPEDVFIFFDDFDGTSLNTSKWSTVQGTIDVDGNGHLLLVGTGGTRGLIESVQKFSAPIRVGSVAKWEDPSPYFAHWCLLRNGSSGHNIDITNDGTAGEIRYITRLSSTSKTVSDVSVTPTPDTGYYLHMFSWVAGTEVKFYYNHELQATHTTYVMSDTDVPVAFYEAAEDNENVSVDCVFVASYATPEPVFSSYGSWQSIGNNPPYVTDPHPANGESYVSVPPSYFSINISDNDGDLMNITWQENSTGVWKTFNTTTNVGNGTYYAYNTSWVSEYNTKYWWRVCVYDGEDWTNQTYYFITAYSYTEQAPHPSSWWDGVYENYTEVGRWAWMNTSKTWNATAYYKPFMLDKIPTTHFTTVSFNISESDPLYIWMSFHNPTNVSFMRFYYYDENGLDYCPAYYYIYADGTQIYEGNYTAQVNGQWVEIDFPDQTNIHNLTWKIVATRGSIDSGNPTKVSISEIEVFSNEQPLVIKQETVERFVEIPRWWNGLDWAISWRVDDVDTTSDFSSWVDIMPLTICWMKEFANINDTYVDLYHIEIASHWEQVHQSQANWDYSTAYSKATYGIQHIEENCTKTSLWSDKVITFGVPYSRYNPHYALAYYDAGFRAMGYSQALATDSAPNYKHTASWLWLVRDPQNMSLYNVVLPHYESDFIFYRWRGATANAWDDTEYVKARENHSWILTINHPGEPPQTAFINFIESDTTGWHCTIGEMVSYTWYRMFTNVTKNTTASNSEWLVLDVNIHNSDSRIWEVPLTFKINISGLEITNDTINGRVVVKWRNGTVYKDTWENIGGFSTGSGQHTNQTMREGFRIEGDFLYLSFKPGTQSAQKSIWIGIGANVTCHQNIFNSTGSIVSEKWGNWVIQPSTSNINSTNYLKATNTGGAPGNATISWSYAYLANGSNQIPFSLNGQPNIRYWWGEGNTPADVTTWNSATDSDSTFTISIPAGSTVWVKYEIIHVPPVPAGEYTQTFTWTAT